MKVRPTAIALLFMVFPQLVVAQKNSVVGVVVARETGERLAYSIVGLPTIGRERFATDSGVFYFGELSSGTLPLRIRRLGYTPLDTFVTIGAGQPDTVRIALSRVAMQLSGITVRAHPPCMGPGPPVVQKDSVLSVIFSQIRLNAEQYRFLAEQYPFYYVLEVIRSSRLKRDGQTRIDSHVRTRLDGKSDWKYKPGRVFSRRRGGYFFHIPTLVDLADRDFLAQHCFHFGGMERVDDGDLIRVDLVAAERIKDPDVNGTIYLDPRTFQVRRTVLRLSRIPRTISHVLQDFEVTTEFREIMPSIPIITHVHSVETISPNNKIAFDAAYETQKFAGFEFLRRRPGDDVKRTP